MGWSDGADFVLASTYVVAWVEGHHDALLAGDTAGDITAVNNGFVTLSDLPPLAPAA